MAGVDDLFYTSASTGETVSLNSDGLFFGTALEMRGYEFEYTSSIDGLADTMLKPVEAKVEATVYDRIEWDILRRLAVQDTYSGVQGTFTALDKLGNKWTRKGNFVADDLRSLPSDVLTTNFTIILYGYWWKETLIQCVAQSNSDVNQMLDYPYDFEFDYGMSNTSATFTIANGLPADAVIRIYGTCVNPRIRIAGNTYGVNTTVGAGERLDIDTAAKTVQRVVIDGTGVRNVDEYANRVKGAEDSGSYIFKQIPAGQWDIHWDNTFNFEVLIRERETETPWML